MRTRNNFYLLIILLIIPLQSITAQTDKTGVLVEVTINNKTPQEVKTRFANFVKGKLLKLDGVALVNDNENYKINIMMFRNRTKEGESLGYVISTIFLAPSECEGYKTYQYLTSLLSTAKESELDSTAGNIALSFKENVMDAP